MSVQIKQLGSGTINVVTPLAKQDVGAAVGAGKARIVKNIRLVNGAASAPTYITLYLNTGTDVLISPVNLYLAAGAMYLDETEITMEEDHIFKIELSTSGGGPVHYTISGIERDV